MFASQRSVSRDISLYSPFEALSIPVELADGASSSEQATGVPLFESRRLGPVDSRNAHWVCNTGGPIWALDWCPAALPCDAAPAAGSAGASKKKLKSATKPSAPVQTMQCVALSAHGSRDGHSTSHRLGAVTAGKNILQIWETPPETAAGSVRDRDSSGTAIRKPRLLFGIAHEAGLAWCVCRTICKPLIHTSAPQTGPGSHSLGA